MNPRLLTSSIRRRRTSSDAFTLPELILGIAITAMIGGSCAAVALSVSTGWKQADSSNAEYLTKGRTSLYVQSVLRGAKRLGVIQNGSLENPAPSSAAKVLFWRADLNGDEAIQLKEVALLEHAANREVLRLYEATFSSPAVESTANVTLADSWLTDPSSPAQFEASPYVSWRVAGRGVVGARFDAINTGSETQRPSIEFLLKMNLGTTGASYEYGSATLRPPR